ncbi:hypothetical protein EYV94_21505 [Puteibacter caeruleilacunae]|nr:hypothetical protein EYV94_21505 [Puteibacter caeruleilacunae]
MRKTTFIIAVLMFMSMMTFAQYHKDGNFTISGKLGINTMNPLAGLDVNKATVKFSNLKCTYRWRWGGGNTKVWKKIADIQLSDQCWQCASMEVIIFDSTTNFGYSVNGEYFRFNIAARRSSDTNNNLDTGVVSGPIDDYVRLVKTAIGQYEVQCVK